MLCLKAEAFEEDPQSSPSSSNNANGNGGFVLPINWGSSIQRYLQWKSGKELSRSFSAEEESSSDLEESKPQGLRSQREKRGRMTHYKYQLEQDVLKLQQQLQEETNLHLALASAVEHSELPSLDSPSKLPDKAQELLDSIAVLEITVSKLEEESVALQYQLSQERNERRLAEYRLKHSSSPAPSLFNCSPAYRIEPIARPSSAEEAERDVDDMPLWQDIINKDYFVENLWHHPNKLSEEMVLRMRDIFLFLAESSKLSAPKYMASPSSPHSHFAHSLASFSDSSNKTSLASTPSRGKTFDPYGVPGKVDWTSSIGPYSVAIEVSWLSIGKKELEYAAMALKRFRLLVEQLARVDPSHLSCNEKLAFWINLYNALIMHAYLAYGVPRSDIKLFSLMQKAAYTVGGFSFSAADIEYGLLKTKPPAHRPQIALVLTLQKLKVSEEQQKYSIDHPEPLLSFALSCGLHSSPAVRIFRPDNLNELLNKSLKDYIRASVAISSRGKLLVPKLLHCFAKGVIEDSQLPEWICQFLTPEQASMVRDCLSHNKWRLLGARTFSILPFDSRFRFLFLFDVNSCVTIAQET
ncbi:hypothetical protein SLEP1_g15985 [Rubroshorea leprosula]|uniref:Uncharacterized protein n=1 Tax=Rubroshorea leprosula TaxID=152421 RepID=A0AAV5IV87_9ROSI|nr:hypothetical protein SLEP1_g15985 [Rubroshorea leprosula]